MAIAFRNVTVDVYHAGNSPPAAPDLAGVKGFLRASYARRKEAGEGLTSAVRFSHVLLVNGGTDIRSGEADPFIQPVNADVVYVPDQNGTAFDVVHVEEIALGTPLSARRCYLNRRSPTFPTTDL